MEEKKQEKIRTWVSGDLLKSDDFSKEMVLLVDGKPFGFVHPEDFRKFLPEKIIRPFLPKEIYGITKKMENGTFGGGMIISEDMMKRIDLSPKPFIQPEPTYKTPEKAKERNLFFPKENKIPSSYSPEEKKKKSMRRKSKPEHKLL